MKRLLIWIRKPHDGIIVDRRGKITCWATVLSAAWLLAWTGLSIAVATTLPTSQEQALTQGDLTRAQWWIISGLIGAVVVIGQGFIIYVVSGIKSNVRKLFELHENVLTESAHDRIDHSKLCPVCRNVKLKIDGGGK